MATLVYLDANIVQYCADYRGFIFEDGSPPSGITASLRKELVALRKLVEIELQLEQLDFENRWDFAAPTHLMKELFAGKPREKQRDVYSTLLQAWAEFGRQEYNETTEERISSIEKSLRPLKLKDASDRWHLAEAISLGASWFLTNDKDIIKKTRPRPAQAARKTTGIVQNIGVVQGVRIARPSECAEMLSFDPVFGLIESSGHSSE